MISSLSQEKLKTNYPQQGITAKIVSLPADPQSNSVTSGMFGGNKLSKILSEKSSPKSIKISQNLDTRQRSSNRQLEKSSAVYLRGSYERNGQVMKDRSLDSFQTDRRIIKKQFETKQLRKTESSQKIRTEEVHNNEFNNLETSIRWVVSPCKSRSKDRQKDSYQEQQYQQQSQTAISLSSLPQTIISQITKDTKLSSCSNTIPSFNFAKLNTSQNRMATSYPTFSEDEMQIGYSYNQPIIKKKVVLQTNSFQTQYQQFQKLQKIQQSYQQYPSKMTPFHTPIALHSNSNITMQTPLKPFTSNSNSLCRTLPLNMQSSSQSPANVSFQVLPGNSSQQIASINNLESPDKLGRRISQLKHDRNFDTTHSVTLSSFQMKLGIERSDTDRGAHRQPSIHFETTRHSNEDRYKNNLKSNNYFTNSNYNAPATCNNFKQKRNENQLSHANSVRDLNSVKVTAPSGNLNKQYKNGLAGVEVRSWQTRLEEQQRHQPNSKHCLLSQVFEKEGINLSELNQIQDQKKQTQNQYATTQTLLRFPASQKELQEFSQALDQNELRFARVKDQHTWLNQERLGSTSNLLRPLESKEPASMKIEAKVKERNYQIEQQDIEQRKFTFDLKMRQTAQLDNLLKEQISLQQQQSMKTTGRRSPLKVKKDNYQQQQQQLLETSLLRQEGLENNISPRDQLIPSKEEAERELAKETHLVDFLQQKKRKVRDVLERFLESRPRFVKAISRSCLMDIEQFMFFTMSFFQYCIDDMFARFKTSNTLRLAAIASKDVVSATAIIKNDNSDIVQIKNNNNNNNINHHCSNQFNFMIQTNEKLNSNSSQPQQNTSAVDVQSLEFNFSQKIPQEIMKIVLEVIKHTLAGTEKELRIEETLQGFAQQSEKQVTQGVSTSNQNNKSSLKKNKISKEKPKYDSNSIYNNMQQILLSDTLDIATEARGSEEVFLSEIDDKAKQSEFNLENQGIQLSNKKTPSIENDCFSSSNEKISWLNTNVIQQFMHVMEWNVKKQILPQTIIEQMGGFVRVRQLIQSGIKTLNNYINTASKMNLLEEDDIDLLDKHLMACICGLLSDDIQTVVKEIAIWKDRGNQMSVYDFYTVKKVVWDITTMIKLDPKLRFQIILQIENLRYLIFSHPFSSKMESLPHSLMNNYQLANYFRNPKNPVENANFFQALFPVMYSNKPYSGFYDAIAGKLKFQFNDRFFDHLLRFLMEQLKDTDLKSKLDLQIRVLKLRIKAGVCYNFLKVIDEDADQFFENLLPFLQVWVQKYTLSNTLMEAKAMDFQYLEVFIKQALNIQDLYAISDTEPALLHFVINESMLIFWIKGIIAFFEDKNIPKQHYKPLIQFITQYLLFRKEIEQPTATSEKDII